MEKKLVASMIIDTDEESIEKNDSIIKTISYNVRAAGLKVSKNFELFMHGFTTLVENGRIKKAIENGMFSDILSVIGTGVGEITENNFMKWGEDIQAMIGDDDADFWIQTEEIINGLLWGYWKDTIAEAEKKDIPYNERLKILPPKFVSLDDSDPFDESIDWKTFVIRERETEFSTGSSNLNIPLYCGLYGCVCAFPSVGKSMFLLNMGMKNIQMTYKTDHPVHVVYISLEMNKQQCANRCFRWFYDDPSKIDQESYNYSLKDENYQDFMQYMHIFSYSGLDGLTLENKIETILDRLMEDDPNCKILLLIDYLLLWKYMKVDEWASLRRASRYLSVLSKHYEKNVLVFTASQLNKEAEIEMSYNALYGGQVLSFDCDIIFGIAGAPKDTKHPVHCLKDRDNGNLGVWEVLTNKSIGKIM